MENNIRAVRKARGITSARLAEMLDVGTPQVSRWERGLVDIPASRLEAIAKALNCEIVDLVGGGTSRSLEGPQPNARTVPMEGASYERMREDLPIYGSALGAAREVDGEAVEQTTLNRAEIIAYAKRPVLLNGNTVAYGVYVAGSSMDPRYRDGEMVLVDPKGRVFAGEDVIVYLRTNNEEDDNGEAARAVLIKHLIRRTSTYIELEQYSPSQVFRIPASEVVNIHRVIPWQELLG